MSFCQLQVGLMISSSPPSLGKYAKETYVYICTGPGSKRYHISSRCMGLSNCSKSIKKVTLKKAKSMKRTPCKMCCK